jgi:glycine/D-amino acid oxidase-like deaminating enzyme
LCNVASWNVETGGDAVYGPPASDQEYGRNRRGAETIIVNCTGLGSQEICRDKLVHPIKGQLVLLPPQLNLQYLFAGHHGYLFPRHDAVVVGGSEETNPIDEKPDLRICRQILANMRGVFEANQTLVMSAEAVPEWAMRSK